MTLGLIPQVLGNVWKTKSKLHEKTVVKTGIVFKKQEHINNSDMIE